MKTERLTKTMVAGVYTLEFPPDIEEALGNLRDVADLDGGYGEFDDIISHIIAKYLEMETTEFEKKFSWDQVDFGSPIFIYER